MNGLVHAIISTTAFGAGIDKQDVRYVIHGTLPNSIEDHIQQIGRGGRDGKKTHCSPSQMTLNDRFSWLLPIKTQTLPK